MQTLRFTLAVLLLVPCWLHAQNTGKVSGKIFDATSNRILEGATISVLDEETGIFIRHAVSGKKGEFTIGGLPLETKLAVIISYTAYRDTTTVIIISANKRLLNTGEWKMVIAGDELDEVVVTRRRAPFIVKKDTLEFNAAAFKSLPTDMVQDLLRKLPGLVIDEQGNVTVNGKNVNRIKVDGRDFFGSNIKVATENLPGAIIEKVQVYETRERGDENKSVIQPAGKDVTLNLTLRKNNRKGIFGSLGAGTGTEDRYNAGAFINLFNEGKRLTLLGGLGNIAHLPGMSEAPIEISAGSGQDGIIKNSSTAGTNFNNDLGKKGRVAVNYMMDNNNRKNTIITNRTNLLPDSSFLYNSNATSNIINRNHRLNAEFTVDMDTLQSLTVAPMIGFSENITDALSDAASTTVHGENINTQQNRNLNHDRTFNVNNRLLYNRSSADRKTSFNLNWDFGMRQGRGDQYNLSHNNFYTGSQVITASLDQSGALRSNGISNNISLNINRQLTKKLVTIINYTFMQNGDKYDKDVFNFNYNSGKHDLLDSAYSIHNKNTGITHLPSASMGYRGEKLSVEFGAGMRMMKQDNKIIWKDSVITVNQHNFTPRTGISYRINKNSQFVAHYTVNADQPIPAQLAPVQDNINPLYIKVGNPFLQSAITHAFNSEIRYFTADYKWHATLRGSGILTDNQIVEDAFYDNSGRQVSTFRNVNGATQFDVHVGIGSRARFSDWNFTFDIGSGLNSINAIGFVNREQNNSRTFQINPQVHFGMHYKNALFLHVNAAFNMNEIKYSMERIEDISYNTKRIMLISRWQPLRRLAINTSVFHFYNSQLPEDFQRARTLINSSVSYNFLKNERLTVGISVNDILNNNTTVNRAITPNAIENTQVDALRRYAMLTANYRLSNFTGS